ncbi:MAG: VCBS repeat-containing protein [Candidatus Krumholzibacteriota bacterium]|nr:VCBS repeat-containing protein [Candidatus Krumholzibacteriota bacterium]
MIRRGNPFPSNHFRLLAVLLAGIACAMPGALLAGTTAPIDAANPGEALVDAAIEGAEATADVRTAPPILPGWPQVMGTHPTYSPVGVVLADLERDGDLEVLAGSTDNLFYVWEHDGTLRPGWPVDFGYQIQSKAAAADLDGDGDLEILIAVKSGQLHILRHDGTPLAGWPQPTGFTYGFLSPSVYDLDDDGTPDVLLGGGGSVRVWNADGVPRSGWPQSVSGSVSGTLAIGDLDGDPAPEIFAVATSGNLYGFDADGTPLAGWPAAFGLSSSYAAPAIGDLDGDGAREICVVGYVFGQYTEIHAFRGDGSPLPGFPVSTPSSQTYSCPVLGDADGDGDLELFNAGKIMGDAIYAWDHRGAVLPGWPVAGGSNMEGSAIVVDFDGLPGMEMAVGDNSGPGLIYGYNLDGSVATDFPIPKPGISGPNSPEVGDVDGDGDLDMAMTMWDGSVVVWDFATSYNEDGVEWGALFHDDWNTNQHGFVVPVDLTPAPDSPWMERVALGPAFPNPVGRRPATVTFSLPREADVQLGVYDIAGRRVRLLHAGPLPGGEHRVIWDGRDEAGRQAAAGVYFLSLETARAGRLTAKITVVR